MTIGVKIGQTTDWVANVLGARYLKAYINTQTQEEKIKIFCKLLDKRTNRSIAEAANYFYQYPQDLSEIVQNLAAMGSSDKALKKFFKKIADPEVRLSPFMEGLILESLEAPDIFAHKAVLKPIEYIKETFNGIDQNRKVVARNAPRFMDIFNLVDNELHSRYGAMIEHKKTFDYGMPK
jgi:hypothetical protein